MEVKVIIDGVIYYPVAAGRIRPKFIGCPCHICDLRDLCEISNQSNLCTVFNVPEHVAWKEVGNERLLNVLDIGNEQPDIYKI